MEIDVNRVNLKAKHEKNHKKAQILIINKKIQ